jgi:enolase
MKNSNIKTIRARQILDCKGKPMLEVDVFTEGGILGRGASPSGISAGTHEAFVLRDNDPDWYNGLGVFKAIDIVHNIIAPALEGMDVMDQRAIDEKLIALDGTEYKVKLGGNTLYSVSLACIRAAANTLNMPLYRYLNPDEIKTIPFPTVNCISGGSYQKGSMPFQECTVVPYKAKTILEAVHILCQIYQLTPEVIRDYQNGKPPKPGSLSGWQAPSVDPMVSFDILYEAAKRCGVEDKIAFAVDCACSELYNTERKTYDFVGKEVDLDTVLGCIKELTTKYDFLYVEDPVDENDWEGWQKATKVLQRTVVVGDDLTVTNIKMLKKAVEMHACEGFIFKPNQVGTITECIAAHEYAQSNGIITIPSIRAGGVGDDSIFDMAVAFGCCATKQGPPRNGERTYGINFLTRAEDENPNAMPYDFTPHIRF